MSHIEHTSSLKGKYMEERDRKRIEKEERALQLEGIIESEERWRGGEGEV